MTESLKLTLLKRLVYAHHGYIYFRQLPDSRLLVGGWRHGYVEEEAGYTDVATHGIQNALEGFIERYFTESSGAEIKA